MNYDIHYVFRDSQDKDESMNVSIFKTVPSVSSRSQVKTCLIQHDRTVEVYVIDTNIDRYYANKHREPWTQANYSDSRTHLGNT